MQYYIHIYYTMYVYMGSCTEIDPPILRIQSDLAYIIATASDFPGR